MSPAIADFLQSLLDPSLALMLVVVVELYRLKAEVGKLRESLKWLEWLVKRGCADGASG